MTQKYTVVIDPELHDWFAHQAINVKSTISALITEAMETYRRARTQKKIIPKSGTSTADTLIYDSDIPETKPKPYVKKIYRPNTTILNDTPRALAVSKAARKVISILKKAAATGVPAQELHDTLEKAGFTFQTRRETLTYLQDNKFAKRGRDRWVHAEFFKRPNA